MKQSYVIQKPADFRFLIEDLLAIKSDPLIITLQGDLGAGKTTFTQELGKTLGITEPITSPTFTVMKQYEITGSTFTKLVHIDAYRFESEDETGPLRFTETFDTRGAIICIEWPEKIPSLIPSSAVQLEISINDDESRTVTVKT